MKIDNISQIFYIIYFVIYVNIFKYIVYGQNQRMQFQLRGGFGWLR